MPRECVQIGPNTWRWMTIGEPAKRSDLPLPNVISDIMPPTEQVDGKFYTSKRQFRAVGRAHGLTEVGNEKFKKKVRSSESRAYGQELDRSIKDTFEKYEAGIRPGSRRI